MRKIIFSKQPSTTAVAPDADFVVDVPEKALLKNYVLVSAKAISGKNYELLYVPASGETQKIDTMADNVSRCVWR